MIAVLTHPAPPSVPCWLIVIGIAFLAVAMLVFVRWVEQKAGASYTSEISEDEYR